ncbi:ABC transporter permease [Paenibacillus cymbidii]|uniref:ABC transporter permease n=1 Tax=Paenibacillus cymbidii TaxID=1639034 RepID=UPI0010808C77|nr:ABC transporter permease [Paenibacillus cymbidii]
MNNFIWLIRKTVRTTFRRKMSWFLFFVLPIIGVMLAMLINGNGTSGTLRVGIVNLDGGETIARDAAAFVTGLDNIDSTETDEATLKHDIAAGKLDSGVIFESGFSAALRGGSSEPHVRIVSVKGAQATAYVKSLLQNYAANVAAIGKASQGDSAAFERMYAGYRQPSFKLTASMLKDTSNNKDAIYQSIGYLITFMMFSAVNLTDLILKEKENRTFLRLLSSPLSARTYVLANVAVNFFILLLQIAVVLVCMTYVFHIDTAVPAYRFLPALLLFALAAISLSLVVVAFAKSSKTAGALQNLIITPTCLLAGCFFPMDIMPDTMKRIATFMPQHWLLDTVNKLQAGEAFGSWSLNLAILLAFAAAFAIIAIYRFSRNNDTRQFV